MNEPSTIPFEAGSCSTISAGISNLQISQYLQIAAVTFTAYDYLILLADEVKFIWKGERNSAAVVFLLTRYSPFIEHALLIAQQFALNPSTQFCRGITTFGACLYLLGIAVSHGILILQLYVVCDRSKYVAIFFATLLVAAVGGGGYLVYLFLASLTFTSVPVALRLPTALVFDPQLSLPGGCLIEQSGEDVLWIASLFAVAYELAIISLTWYKVVHQGKHRGSLLMRTLTADGLAFYCYMLVTSIANVLVLKLVPGGLQIQIAFIQRFVHASISCRLILRLRRVSGGDRAQLGAAQFAQPAIRLARPLAQASASNEAFELKHFPKTVAEEKSEYTFQDHSVDASYDSRSILVIERVTSSHTARSRDT